MVTKSTIRLLVAMALGLAARAAFGQQTPSAPFAPSEWTPTNVIALVTAVLSGIVAIIAALKGQAAQTQSTANSTQLASLTHAVQSQSADVTNRLNAHEQSIDQRLDSHGTQIASLAQNMIPPAILPQITLTSSKPD